ncbi:MAG: type 2 periplasmic-binding domain-containing protein, partial [Candidatus Xenobia bacterium]
SGELGILITGPQFLGRVHDNAPTVYAYTRVAPLPTTPSGIESAAIMDFVVPRASHHQKEAVDLALFLTNDENQLAFCKKVAILPSRVAAARAPFFTARATKTIEDQAIAYSLAMLPRARDLSLGLPHMQDLSRIIQETLEAALLGRMSARDALNDACRRWDEILASS